MGYRTLLRDHRGLSGIGWALAQGVLASPEAREPDATTPARGPASRATSDGDQRSRSTGPLALRSMVVVVLPTSRWRMREWP